MSRSHRISRGLIGLLGVVIVLGLAFYLNNVRKSSASEVSAASVSSEPAPRPLASSEAPQSGQVGLRNSPPTRTEGPPLTPPATNPTRVGRDRGLPVSPSGDPSNRSSIPLADALTRKSAGDLLGARKLLNDALVSARLTPADADTAKKHLAEISQSVVFSPKVFAGDEFASSYTVKSGELLRTIADRHDVPWELLLRLNNLTDPRKLRAGQNIKVVNGPFHAVVHKGRYAMDIFLGSPGEKGSVYVRSFAVGLGENDSTPTGSWLVEVHKKIKNPTYFSPRGEGVIDADDPKNPLGERWIGLTGIDGQAVGKQSYGIHGTIEPQTIGQQASMGCIRLRNEDVELVFDMLTEGKSVVVVRD